MMILRLCRSEYILRVKFVKRRTIKLNQEQIQFSCDVIPVLFEFHVRPAEVTIVIIFVCFHHHFKMEAALKQWEAAQGRTAANLLA